MLENIVVADERVVHVDPALVGAVGGERGADTAQRPDRVALESGAEAAAALRAEAAQLRDAHGRQHEDPGARDLDELVHAAAELALEGRVGGTAVVVGVAVAATAVTGLVDRARTGVVVTHEHEDVAR